MPTLISTTGTMQFGNIIASSNILQPPIDHTAIQDSPSRLILGHPIRIYSIPQVINLTYPVSTYQGIIMNNYPVNRTDFRLIRGVNNAVLFFVRDIDRKPVATHIDDKLTINIVDTFTDTLLMKRNLTPVDVEKGLYNFTTLPAEMDSWPTGSVRWGITLSNQNGTMMLWTDQNYSPYSTLEVTDSPFPRSVDATILTWSDFTLVGGLYHSPQLTAAAQEGYNNGMQTFVIDLTNFSGEISIEGTLKPNPTSGDWFIHPFTDINGQTFSVKSYTGIVVRDVLNVQGNFIWLRMIIAATTGSIEQVQYKE